ncbi:MAG: hypothetical protein CMH83_06505, partial [Nocardioides sp.]|nr:hypothetical protein [Nocardioides sp.]
MTGYDLLVEPVAGTESEACASPSSVDLEVGGEATGAVVPGLCAQVAYTVTMTATNAAGTSAPSDTSDPAVPTAATSPRNALVTGALPRDGRAVLSWSPPTYDGGADLTGYQLTATPTGGGDDVSITMPASSTAGTITGLTNGTEYEISLVATNTVGDAAPATTTLTPSAAYLPGAPTDLAVVPDGAGGIALAWSAPDDDGGDSTDSYTIQYVRSVQGEDGTWAPASDAEAHELTIDAPAAGVTVDTFEDPTAAYLFQVAATNGVGTGAWAAASSGVTPQVSVTDATVVLSSETIEQLDYLDGERLKWIEPAPAEASSLSVGDVLVTGTSASLPQGLLREVVAVESAAGSLVVRTVDASLDDVFTSMTMSADLDPTATVEDAPAPTFKPGSEGVAPVPQQALGIELKGSLGKTFGVDKKFGAAFVKVQAGFKAEAKLNLSVHQNVVGYPDGVDLRFDAGVSASAAGTVGIKGERDFLLGTIIGSPLTFTVGPVPVVIIPKVDTYLTISGEVAVSVSAQAGANGGFAWSSRDPGKLTPHHNAYFKVSGGTVPGVSATGTGFLGLKARLINSLYGAAGPSLTVTAGLEATINFNPRPGDAWFTLGPKVDVSAGLAFSAFGLHGELELRLTGIDFDPWVIQRVPSASYVITAETLNPRAGTPVQLTAERSDGATENVTWTVVDGVSADSVTNGGVFTAAEPSGRHVSIAASDSSGAEGTISLKVGKRFDSPPSLTLRQPSDAVALDISWSRPSSLGEGTLAGYILTTTPSTGRHVLGADDQSLLIEDLSPGDYSVSLYAKNSLGRLSAPTSRSIVLTPLCTNTFIGSQSDAWNVPANWSEDRLPGNAEWVCTAGRSVHVPPNFTANVSGLQAAGSQIELDGELAVSSYLDASTTAWTGSGVFTAGEAIRWSLSGSLAIDVVNRGTLSVTGRLEPQPDTRIVNHGTLQLADPDTGDSGYIDTFSGSDNWTLINQTDATIDLRGGTQNVSYISRIAGTLDNHGTLNITTTPNSNTPLAYVG